MSHHKAKTPQCWSCLRRNKECDGTIPVCNTCREDNIVCSNYKNTRPFTWLRTGKVSRLGKSKVLAHSDQSTTRTKSKSTPKTVPALQSPSTSETSATISPEPHDEDENEDEDEYGDEERDEEMTDQVEEVCEEVMQIATPTTATPNELRLAFRNTPTPTFTSSSHTQTQVAGPFDFADINLPRSLFCVDWDIVGDLDQCNYMNVLDMTQRQILPTSPDMDPIVLSISDYQMMRPSMQHSVRAIMAAFKITRGAYLNGTNVALVDSRFVSNLWKGFYHHTAKALAAINDDIAQQNTIGLADIIRSIWLLIIVGGWFSDSLSWRPHVVGLLRLLSSYGGFGKVATSIPAVAIELRDCIIWITIFNTTSPRYDQVVEASEIDLNDALMVYRVRLHISLYCPPSLFLDIIRINRLRLDLAINDTLGLHAVSPSICHLLESIDSYTMRTMFRNWPEPDKLLFTIAQIFRSAVAVYGSLTVPCLFITCNCHKLREFHRDNLFHLIKTAVNYPVHAFSVFWPLVVAGVAAHSLEERALVEEHMLSITRGGYNHGTSPFVALAVLRKFWQSGKTSWDECFDKPYSIIA